MWKKEGKIDDKKRGQTNQYSGRGDVDRNGPYRSEQVPYCSGSNRNTTNEMAALASVTHVVDLLL
jgi:hypothetical protein